MLKFEVHTEDSQSQARSGRLLFDRGVVHTPTFMPVGTYGAVRGLSAWELEELGAEIMLSNTYHLMSRPGLETLEELGGLHRFSAWKKPILTDSGGFQIYSLAKHRKITDEGVEFQDPLDGNRHFMSPESCVDLQERYGSDIMMVLDECPPANADRATILAALERTSLWADRCKKYWSKQALALFPIVQGGCDPELRQLSLKQLLELESDGKSWPGIAVGGLSVGEDKPDFVRTLNTLAPQLPKSKPHYLMGVGTPRDLVFGVRCGIDMFDCVIPSRNARHGVVMSSEGRHNLFNQQYQKDERPIDSRCSCKTCQTYSRGFLRHLFQKSEPLGQRLATLHNVAYFVDLMRQIRSAIDQGVFGDFSADFLQDPKNIYLGREKDFFDYDLGT